MTEQKMIKTLRLGTRGEVDIKGLIKTVEDAYLASRSEKRFTAKNSFSPSSLGYGSGTCPRYWYIAFNGAEFVSDFTALSIANMSNGTYAHSRVEAMFGNAGVLEEAEKELISQDPPIRGFADMIVSYKGHRLVGEFKTTRQEAFVHREVKETPVDYHKVQLLVYMRLLGINGFLMYENKNTQELLIIPVNMDEENTKYTDEIFEWMRSTRAAWEAKTLPKRPFTKKSKACKSCPVFDTCWSKEDGQADLPALEVK